MAHHQSGRDVARALGRLRRLADRKAEAIHPGVEMDRGFGLAAQSPPIRRFRRANPGRDKIGGDEARRRAGHEPVQHIDGRVVGDGPGRFAFDDIGDEKGSAAGREQRAHRGREPQAIGVGLHHRAAFRAAGQPSHRAPIVGEGGEVDDQNAGLRRVRRLGPGPQARSGFVDSHLDAILGRKRRRPDGDGILR